jgi:hypothetical protein
MKTLKEVKVLLAPTWELAKSLTPVASVEAEYGENVLEGVKVTLAHHVAKYRHHPAPCNAQVTPIGAGEVVVSHLDLDTVGGLMALMGIKPHDPEFWKGAEFIDLNGPHHVNSLSSEVKEKLQAYWAWNASQPRMARMTHVTDVTDMVMIHADVISRVLSGDSGLLERGAEWAEETTAKVEGCLVEEDNKIRVFATDDVFTAASYYSPNLDVVASVTVNYNTKLGSITLATSDKSVDCCEVMQKLFGPGAGGHAGIAGSPRGTRMSLRDFNQTVDTVRQLVK